MSAEIPQNRMLVKMESLESLQSVVQHHEKNSHQPHINESEAGFPSKTESQEAYEQWQKSEMKSQPVQQMSQRSPLENSGQNELLLQLQVKHLQRLLQEQNALLSLISPGLILSPTFLPHWQVQTPLSASDAGPVSSAGNSEAFKENSTKPTSSGELESDSDALETHSCNAVAASAELRRLSPIREEPSDPAEEDCPMSPFGLRQGLPPNPEERPIRPGLRKEQKTFEEFVEEHLKTDQAVHQDNIQAKTQIREAQKRNFLRKGEGTSRISKGKDCSRSLQKRRSISPQMMNMKSSVQADRLHQKETSNRSSPGLNAVGNLTETRSGRTFNVQEDLSANSKGKGKEKGDVSNNADSPKAKQSVGVERNCTKTNGSKSAVRFKKVNDHIVKVHKMKCLPANYCLQSQSGNPSKEASLMDEMMESLALSDSSSEDGADSQSPLHLPKLTDQSLDLSDGDYASDTESETPFNEDQPISTPTSSSFSSDSELKSLGETQDRQVNSDFRSASAPESLTKTFPEVTSEDTHRAEQGKTHPSVREKMEEHGFNDEGDCRPWPKNELQESQELREQVWSLQQQLMERQSLWSQTHQLLQKRVEALTRENQELHGRLTADRGSHSTFEMSREEPQRVTCVRSSTPASIHRTHHHNANGRSVPKSDRTAENTADKSLRKNSSFSSHSSQNNDTITQSGKGSLLYPHNDPNDAQTARNGKVREEIRYPDGRVERLFWNGCRVITFRNGTKKEIDADKSVTITFFNGDVKRTLADGTVIYYYCDAQTTHTTYPSGLEVVQFPNNQTEKHHPDGTREITFPDGTVKILHCDGREESIFSDGTVVKISQHGEKIVEFTNGQREIHTSQYKRRIFPDGTVKTVYTNGRQETKFTSGRIRIRNNQGAIIMDKK